jgi:hypothetical protein
MSDQTKDEDNTKDYYEYEPTGNDKSDSSTKKKNIKDRIVEKITPQIDKFSAEEKGKNVNLSESARVSNNVRAVIMGLFVLIGFIILVFAIFTASIGSQIAQSQFANSVFIAAIVGAFTLVGALVYHVRGNER